MKTTKRYSRGVLTDFLLLVGLLGALLLLSLAILRLFGVPANDTEPKRIEYTLTLEGQTSGTHAYIHEGDRVIDRTNRKLLGTVSSVEYTDYLEEVYNEAEGVLVMRRIPGRETVRVVITADTHTPYTVAGKALSIGSTLSFRTRDFYGSGTVLEIRT